MISKNWSRSTRYLVLVLALLLTLWFLYQSRAMLGPLAISALLAYILNPLVNLMHHRARLGRSLVVLLVYLVSLAALILASVITIQVVSEQTTAFTAQMQTILNQIQSDYLTQPIIFFSIRLDPGTLLANYANLSGDFISADVIVQVLQSTTTNLGWILVVIVTTYYLLLDWAKLRDWFFKWTPSTYTVDMQNLYNDIRQVWNRYFKGQLRLSLIVGFLTAVGGLLIGLPGAILFGLLAAVFDVLLSIGPAIVIAIATAVAIIAGSTHLPISNLFFAIVVLSLFSLVQMVENIWLRPRIMSSSLKIHPAIIFVAIVASLAMSGIFTALIIVPVIGSLSVLARYIYFKLFELDPWVPQPSPPTPITSLESQDPAS
jgi:predicted PurR-regulated permease PerM